MPNILSKLSSKEKPQEKFLAIDIGSETITTALWQVVEGKTQVVSIGTNEEWETSEKNESLLNAIDTSLAKTSAETQEEPNKVIFGLQEGWVDGDGIAKKHTKILKEICAKFEFEPIGFVVSTEAVIQLLKKQEGTPATAILIRVGESEIQISVVNLGKIAGSETVARSEDIGADVEEGLARFEIDDNFPSQMLLYNSNLDLEKLKQDLLSYNWLEKLPFLHFPKVKILERQIAIKAVTIAGGAEAAKALGFEIIQEEEAEEVQEKKVSREKKETIQKDDLQPAQKEFKSPDLAEAQEIGFQMHTDISKQIPKEEIKTESEQEPPSPKPITQEEFEEQEKKPTAKISKSPKELSKRLKRALLFIPNLIKSPFSKFSKISKVGSKTKVAAITAVVSLILLISIGVYGYWTIPKAKITLFVTPKTLEKELTIIIDPSIDQINAAEFTIPGKILEIEVEGTKEKETTGTKTVGERAKGEVVVYNKTSAEKTFDAGTILIGPDGLTFSLDSDIAIASASSQESEDSVTTTFGKTKSAVTATDIGAEYNISPGKELTIKSFSKASYSAKSDSTFEGGSSREVQAIAQDDVDQLLEELTVELKEKAAQQLEQEEGAGKKVLSDGAKTKTVSQDLSGEVGDEAQTVSATLSLKVTTLAYQESDFDEILFQAVREAIPENFELRGEDSTQEIQSIDFQDELVEIELLYRAALIPDIKKEEIRKNLTGKYPQLAQEYLESLPNFSKAEIEITPSSLPARLKTFPRKAENIVIEIEVEQN